MRWTLAVLAIACSRTIEPEPTDPGDTNVEPPVDTGFPPGDLGNIHVRHDVNRDETTVYALFVESAPNFVTLARCVITESGCLPSLPADEDDPLLFDPRDSLEPETLRTRFVGDAISVGDYALEYRENPETKLGYYVTSVDEEDPQEGAAGVSWGGQWPEYLGADDIYLPSPMDTITPREDGKLTFTNNMLVPIEWVPTGEGEITLTISRDFGDAVVYSLNDDGYFELDSDDLGQRLGLTDEVTDLTATLSRWSRNTLVKFGHVVELIGSSDASFDLQFVQVGTRQRMFPADECAEAQGALALGAGQYFGFLGEPRVDSDYDAPTECLDPAETTFYDGSFGPDAMFRVVVPPRHQYTFDYNLLTESASIYLVENCNAIDATCRDGSDLDDAPNAHEFVSYFNQDDDPQTLYVVLDSTDFDGESFFTLDVQDQFLDEPDMFDTCSQAQASTARLGAGTYWGTFTGYAGHLNPGTGGCTGTSLPGADALTPVELQPGQTLTASVEMPESDPALYVLFNCSDLFSCPSGSDASLGGRETVSYTHNGNFPITVYLVVDSKSGITPYFLTLDIR